MFKSTSQFIPVLVGIFALMGASSSIQFMFIQSAGADGQQQSGTQAQSTETDSEIVVPPWCNWMMNVPEVITFNPIDANGSEISDFIYSGAEQVFRSDTVSESYYISGQNGLTEQAESDNCSWFGEPGVGAGISFSLSGSQFQAYGRDPETGLFDNRVTGMDIDLDDTNPLNLDRTFTDSCSINSFDTGISQGAIANSNFGADFPLVGLNAGAVTTNNFCTADTTYSLNLPASLMPDISNTRYVWFGPTITFTAVMTTDIAVDYASRSAQQQSISFLQPSAMNMTQTGQTLVASASSGLDVGFTSNSLNTCRISSGRVTPIAAGICSITASQSGRALFYEAAAPVTRSFSITKVNQTVNAIEIPTIVGTNSSTGTFFVASNSSGSVNWYITQGSDRCSIVNESYYSKRVSRTWQAGIQCYLVVDIAGDSRYNSYQRIWSVGYSEGTRGQTRSITNGN
jgi:hypothetical protein